MTAPLPDCFLGALCHKLCLLLILPAIVVLGVPTRAATEAQRRNHLDGMLKNLPDAPVWREWQQRTGALPPDFDSLPGGEFSPGPG